MIKEKLTELQSINLPEESLSKLTINQQLFVNEYIKNNRNATQAYMIVYPNTTYHSANGNASRLMLNDSVKIAIDEALRDYVTTSALTKSKMQALNINIVNLAKDKEDYNATLKGIDMIYKTIGAYEPQQDTEGYARHQDSVVLAQQNNVFINVSDNNKNKEETIDIDSTRESD